MENDPGKVKMQAVTTLRAIPQRTADTLLEEPTPIIAVFMVWVVLRGIPKREASSILAAAAVSAENPWYGSSFTIFIPIVLIIRQPPTEVPMPIVREQIRITSKGTLNSDNTPPKTKAKVKTTVAIALGASVQPLTNSAANTKIKTATKAGEKSKNIANSLKN